MNWLKKWFEKPIKYDYEAIDLIFTVKNLEKQVAKLEKELIHWKRIALEFKRPHL